jgi:tetratricopeptide (TPR) repeat protein
MKVPRHYLIVLSLVCGSLALVPLSKCQESSSTPAVPADETYKSQRDFAVGLFKQNHHLEALPIFRQLAKQNPSDAEVIFGWGACLIDHSATLSDDAEAAQERVQARALLIRAKELGNNSPLLLNLLEMLPEDGSIHHDKNAVDQGIRDGEAAFAKNDYDAAIIGYSRAFTLDPKNYSAALFIGDSYFAKKDFSNATMWYERAIQVDPTIETAYRYEADMLIKNGDMAKSRIRSIQAVVTSPYNGVTWRALQAWAKSNNSALATARISQAGSVSQKDDQHINITLDGSKPSSVMSVWMIYSMTRASWRTTEFKKHFPNEKQYRHTLAEESEALRTAASLIDVGNKKKSKDVASDPDLALLKRLYDAKMIEPYVLLSAPDREIAADYVAYRDQHRDQLEQYLSDFIVPAVAVKH